MAEDQSGGIEALEQRLAQEQALVCPSEMHQGGLPMEPLPLSEENDKALVLYNHTNTNAFYKTPASRDFSIIVNSDLIPGLRGMTTCCCLKDFVCKFSKVILRLLLCMSKFRNGYDYYTTTERTKKIA